MSWIENLWNTSHNLSRSKTRILLILLDTTLIFVAGFAAFLLGLKQANFLFDKNFYILFFVVSLITINVLATNGLYRAFLRYLSFDIVKPVTFGTLVSMIALEIGRHSFFTTVNWTIPLIYGPLFSSLMFASRLSLRSIYKLYNNKAMTNVAVYGAGAAGSQLIQSLRTGANYRPLLIIDDNDSLTKSTIYNTPIKNFNDGVEEMKKQGIKLVLLAIPSAPFAKRQKILNKLLVLGFEIKTIPSIQELVSYKTDITKLQDIDIDDLLGRSLVAPIASLMSKNTTSKTVLVTGAGGSIGSALCRIIIEQKPKKLIILDISEFSIYTTSNDLEKRATSLSVDVVPVVGSVIDRALIKTLFAQQKIDTVYQASAYKHVPLMERNMMQALKNNSFGTLILAEEAMSAEVSNFTLISTDKAVNPTNIMGASKRLAELICQSLNIEQTTTRFSIVRFGNVLGSSGSVLPLFQSQIAAGGPLTLTHPDVNRYFMTITEAAQLVIQASSMSTGGDVFVLDMGRPVKIKDLAFKIARLSGLTPYYETDGERGDGYIAVRIIGLRQGEKLYEELSHFKNMVGTVHPRILRVVETALSKEKLHALMNKLNTLINDHDQNSIKELLSATTGYTPFENSANETQELKGSTSDSPGRNVISIGTKT